VASPAYQYIRGWRKLDDTTIDGEYKAVIGQRNAEYRALQSQIQPHFLYNTLNCFVGLNRLKDSAGLEKAILALSSMLHYILEGEDQVKLGDEMSFIQEYCALQRIRFRDRLIVDIHCAEAAAEFKVPKLLLQPLVENAVIHGVEPASRPCTLSLRAELKRNGGSSWVQITVQDNGCGFDPQSLDRKDGLGLGNVCERLNLAFRVRSRKMLDALLAELPHRARGVESNVYLLTTEFSLSGGDYRYFERDRCGNQDRDRDSKPSSSQTACARSSRSALKLSAVAQMEPTLSGLRVRWRDLC
jgi:histidine kinase/histidine kinase/DNA gyrase B/HSP90-like ATPase